MGDSHIYTTAATLRQKLDSIQSNSTIGFLPTMGALHHGHLALAARAQKENDIVVVSIFVNPTQFNNAEDLKKYPRNLEKDVELLNTLGEIYIYAPSVEDVYPPDFEKLDIGLGALGTVMEGEFRPGHFDGMMNVVKRLFDIVSPTRAYFGLKDFQQLAVVKYMVDHLDYPVEIVPCEIVREESGLASSSRNVRLSEEQKQEAVIIIETLRFLRDCVSKYPPKKAWKKAKQKFRDSNLKLEYLEIVHPTTLKRTNDKWIPGANACIAAYCGDVRLIDNMQLVPFDKK